MPWWVPLAAAAVPSVIDGAKSLFGKKQQNAGAAELESLHAMLKGRAQTPVLQQPGAAAAMAQIDQIIGRRKESDEADAAKRGASGTEYEIAQADQRGERYTDALLGVTRQGAGEQQTALAGALQSAGQMNANYWRDKTAQDNRLAHLSSMLQSAATAYTSADTSK